MLLAAVSEFCLNKQKKRTIYFFKIQVFSPSAEQLQGAQHWLYKPPASPEHHFGRMPSSPAENQRWAPEGSPHWLTRADRQMDGPTVEL